MKPFLAAALALLTALLAPVAAAQERLAVPGSSVSMEVPAGFTVASDFAGFENPATGDSIMVMQFPGEAFKEISALFGDLEEMREILAGEGMRIEASETLFAGDHELTVLRGSQRFGVLDVGKWVAFGGPEPVTVTFNLVAPGALDDETVRAALSSLEFGGPVSLADQLAALSFRATPVPPFTTVEAFAGTGFSMTTGPERDPTGLRPLAIVAWQISGEAAGTLEEVAETLLLGSSDLDAVVIEGRAAVPFVEAEGVRFEGSYERDGTPMRFVQYVSLVEGRSVRLLATMTADEAEALRPAIEQIAQSVKRQ